MLNSDVTEIEPVERRLDTALLVETVDGDNHIVIIESQSLPEETRRRSWPYYVAYLSNKHKCPVTLLVVTADEKTAAWAREPILNGLSQCPSQITYPLVLGPDNIPAVSDPAVARQDVTMAVLSALTHRTQPHIDGILETLAEALGAVDQGTAAFLAMFTEVGLGDSPAARSWRLLMTSTIPDLYRRSQMFNQWLEEGRREAREQAIKEGRQEGLQEGRQEGLQEGRQEGLQEGRQEGLQEGRTVEAAAAVLRVLQARGLTVPSGIAERVRACADLDVLESLLTRAATAARAEDIFES